MARRWLAVPSHQTRLALAVLMVIPVVVSFSFLLGQSLRLDEAQSMWQGSHTPSQIVRIVAQDVHVPLYEILTHYWMQLFGINIQALRLMSLVFFVAAIPLTYLLAREYGGRKVALLATTLVALSPFLNWYGSEARMYSLLLLATVASQYFYMRVMRNDSKYSWIGYALVNIVGIYSHYFFGMVLLTQAIYFLLNQRKFAARAFFKFVAVAVVAVGSIVPWLVFVRSLGSAANTQPLIPKPSSIDFFNAYSQFWFGFQPDVVNTIIVSLWPSFLVLGFLAINARRRIPHAMQFFALAAVFPVFAAFFISLLVKPLFLSRYLIVVVPALYIFTAWLFIGYGRRLATTLGALLLVSVTTLGAYQYTSASTPVKEDYKGVGTYLNSRVTPQDVVIVSAPFTVYPIEYYYRGKASLETLPMWEREKIGSIPPFIEGNLPADLNTLKGSSRLAYVVLSYDQGYQETVRQYLDRNYERVAVEQFSPKLTVYTYRLRYDTVPPIR